MTNLSAIGATNTNYTVNFKGGTNLTRKAALKEINSLVTATKPKNLQEVRTGKILKKEAQQKIVKTMMNALQEGVITLEEGLNIITKLRKI